MRRTLRIVPLVLVLLGGLALAEGETVDNPEFAQWSRFGAGSWVSWKTVSEAAGQQSEMTITVKLLSRDEDKLTLETKTTMVAAGQNMDMPAQTREVPAKIEKVDMPPQDVPEVKVPEPKEGRETIEIGGKSYECHTTEVTTEANGATTWVKTWTSDQVPGGMVKTETKMSGPYTMSSTMTLTAFETK